MSSKRIARGWAVYPSQMEIGELTAGRCIGFASVPFEAPTPALGPTTPPAS